jgi:hypothetical protein
MHANRPLSILLCANCSICNFIIMIYIFRLFIFVLFYLARLVAARSAAKANVRVQRPCG